jgi:DNA-binding NtrC family response regulator
MEALRVLIVDDEHELVGALVERLDLRGFDAEGVGSGAAALECIAQQDFDVVLLDLKMPGMGGLEVIQRIHAQKPDLKIILLTGHCDAETTEKGRNAGAYDCLVKPVSIDTLIGLLKQAAGR